MKELKPVDYRKLSNQFLSRSGFTDKADREREYNRYYHQAYRTFGKTGSSLTRETYLLMTGNKISSASIKNHYLEAFGEKLTNETLAKQVLDVRLHNFMEKYKDEQIYQDYLDTMQGKNDMTIGKLTEKIKEFKKSNATYQGATYGKNV